MKAQVNIGGASGYWGDAVMATPQLLQAGNLDYIVYDYLAEITMSILARAHAKDSTKGYATDFIDLVMKPYLPAIAKSGVKIIANAGGVNPLACAAAVKALIEEYDLNLKVGVISGDNLTPYKEQISDINHKDLFSNAPFPPIESIVSINAYLGAFPIAKALESGADIIITGRCVDSAVTLGACIHEFGWQADDWDLLASGSLAGHILECGPQATGGNFTDWQEVPDIAHIGYPIAEIKSDGHFVTTKPKETGGLVSVGTVSEQMLYEIGDPQNYILPDVTCDFSQVTITEESPNRVLVSPAKGRPAPTHYKTCLTYHNGFRAGTYHTFYGIDAHLKAAQFAEIAFERAAETMRAHNLVEFTQTSTEILGSGSQMGRQIASDEVVLKLAVKHPYISGAGLFLKETAGLGLATPPGLSGFTAVRSKPSPVMQLFSYLTPKEDFNIHINMDGRIETHRDKTPTSSPKTTKPRSTLPLRRETSASVPLYKLAWARSGDKGNKANIGVIARKPEYLPYIKHALSEGMIKNAYAHFMEKDSKIELFDLPGSHALNILIDNILGGGGAASLRNDAQGKGYAQILLAHPIPVSQEIASTLEGS